MYIKHNLANRRFHINRKFLMENKRQPKWKETYMIKQKNCYLKILKCTSYINQTIFFFNFKIFLHLLYK